MKRKNLSIIVSVALVGALAITGCNTSAESSNSTISPTAQNSKIGVGSISGKIILQNRKLNSVNIKAQVLAYNITTKQKYLTTTKNDGSYEFRDLPEGTYQVIASSLQTTQKGIRVVNVKRNTREVVDIVLQPAGNVKGHLIGCCVQGVLVTVPGTSYIASVDSNGNFELSNVPAGDVVLAIYYPQEGIYYTKKVSVAGGETINIGDWNLKTYSPVYVVQDKISSVAMKYEGIDVDIDVYQNRDDITNIQNINKATKLLDENNNSIPIFLEFDKERNYYSYNDEGYTYNTYNFTLKTKKVLTPGVYTLEINLDNNQTFTKKITLLDKAVVGDDSGEDGGLFKRSMFVAFSKPTELNSSLITVSDTEGNPLDNIQIKKTPYENVYSVKADFDPSKTYKVTLDESIKPADGIIYLNQNDVISNSGIQIGKIAVTSSNVENRNNVKKDEVLSFYIKNSDGLDLKTVKVTVGNKEYNLTNGLKTDALYNNYDENDVEYTRFYITNPNLNYDTNYSMQITAKDVYGKTLNKIIAFKTIKPQIVGVDPFDEDSFVVDASDIINYDSLNSGLLKAYFNISDVNLKSGTITLHDDTNNKDIATHRYNERDIDDVNIRTDYFVGFDPEEIQPNTTYTMKIKGFKTLDGYQIADKTYTFTTGKKQIVAINIKNAHIYDTDSLGNRIMISFFGKLTDEQKQDIEKNLVITSFDKALPEDKTHPKPLVLWQDTYYGEIMILAFTIDSGKSYEIEFNGNTAKEYSLDTPITFMTASEQLNEKKPVFDLINDKEFDYDFDMNLSKGVYGRGYFDIKLPVAISYNWYDDFNGDGNYEYFSDYCNSLDTDVNVSKWISSDANISIENIYNNTYENWVSYDDNGNYVYKYVCFKRINFDIKAPWEVNKTVSINIPENAYDAKDIKAEDTNVSYVMKEIPKGLQYSTEMSGNYIYIDFSKPVDTQTLKELNFTSKPEGIIDINNNMEFMEYYLGDTNYTDFIEIDIKSSPYAAFKIMANGEVKYYDVDGNVKEQNISVDEVFATEADLTPLKLLSDPDVENENTILLKFNAPVDTNSIYNPDTNESAFEISDDLNNTYVIDGVNVTNCNDDECDVELILDKDIDENATKLTIKQVGKIYKEDSINFMEGNNSWTITQH